jgi:hypothetical protein
MGPGIERVPYDSVRYNRTNNGNGWPVQVKGIATSSEAYSNSWSRWGFGGWRSYSTEAWSAEIKRTNSITGGLKNMSNTEVSNFAYHPQSKIQSGFNVGVYKPGDRAVLVSGHKDGYNNLAIMYNTFKHLGYPSNAVQVLKTPSDNQFQAALNKANQSKGNTTVYITGHGNSFTSPKTADKKRQGVIDIKGNALLTAGKLNNKLRQSLSQPDDKDRTVLLALESCKSGEFIQTYTESSAPPPSKVNSPLPSVHMGY